MQLSFQMWTNQMQETLNSKKKGDHAFRQKDFTTAIDCYSQVTYNFYLFIIFLFFLKAVNMIYNKKRK